VNKTKLTCLRALAALAAVTTAHAAGPEYFARPSDGAPPLPFSESVQVGDLLFLSGTLGVAPGATNVVPGGIGPEAHRVMDNIKAIVERHGGSMDQLVKCTVFLADIKEWPAFNAVYRDYFKTHFPARSAFATNGLALNGRVEVECIAYIPKQAAGH
jgi:2-iminobutanoate/2-iminopropanoate deaminase